jgi:5-methylcytosine-specific restriction endonuclease McrA
MKAPKETKLRKWQKIYNGNAYTCPKCNREGDATVDHIIPVNFLQQIGLHDECLNDEENFEVICRSCNTFKMGRIDMSNPKTIPLLRKYVLKLK